MKTFSMKKFVKSYRTTFAFAAISSVISGKGADEVTNFTFFPARMVKNVGYFSYGCHQHKFSFLSPCSEETKFALINHETWIDLNFLQKCYGLVTPLAGQLIV